MTFFAPRVNEVQEFFLATLNTFPVQKVGDIKISLQEKVSERGVKKYVELGGIDANT